MSDYVPFDEFRLTMLAPKDLEDQSFRSALRWAVRQVIRQYPDLDPIRIRLSG